jgi:hypothetical protein
MPLFSLASVGGREILGGQGIWVVCRARIQIRRFGYYRTWYGSRERMYLFGEWTFERLGGGSM